MKTLIRLFCLSIMLDMLPQIARAQADYTVHEWGTFTSVQGGDGKLLMWRPLQTSELPGFVHNWMNPGLNRFATGIGKGGLVTLQRMETPVIYFYSDEKMTVDVSVDFPKGIITEWYPQASQIGPSMLAGTNRPAMPTTLTNSRAVWKNFEITPANAWQKIWSGTSLPQDNSGSHYFAARGTGADFVRMDLPEEANSPAETEKFIFYRGAGSFKTPLVVSMNSGNEVIVENSGSEKLSHLFLVSIHNGQGAFTLMDELPAANPAVWMNLDAGSNWRRLPLALFQNEIGAQMESALVSEGLFPDEARAMVNTWKDSWFTEEGERVLYLLPRAWTDETLPLTLDPRPKSLARVMVGRAEIITPDAEMNLSQDLSKAQTGDATARSRALAELKTFGRFAWPALDLARRDGASTNAMELGYQLLFETLQSKN